ncbi:hypothetical protein TNCV_4435711 [Trichonephila clavipes]|nr:hypothetical protein TNCV_4435711 [Trichonephila clavipes]
MDSRLGWKAAYPFLLYAGIIICNKCVYASVCIVCFLFFSCISYVPRIKKHATTTFDDDVNWVLAIRYSDLYVDNRLIHARHPQFYDKF